MKVFGFAGPSGSGKTTVIENVIPLFSAMGLSVSVIKHTITTLTSTGLARTRGASARRAPTKCC
jgi:molybdopterin-guanine dinucleotide biosynthesis protein MobB